MKQINELEELMKKATPGPMILNKFSDAPDDAPYSFNPDPQDAYYIVALVNSFPSILQTLKAYEKAIERLNSIDLCYVDHIETKKYNMTICHKCVMNSTSNFWRSERDTILQDLDKKLSEI